MASTCPDLKPQQTDDYSMLSSWGALTYGQAGPNVFSDSSFRLKPGEVDIEFLRPSAINCISLGRKHTVIVDCSGRVFTAGSNDFGQLGRSGNCFDFAEIQSLQSMVIVGSACGDEHTLLLTKDRQIIAFGNNSHGQLGSGLNLSGHDRQFVPKVIKNDAGKHFVRIACGSQFSLALSRESEVYGWGQNRFHQVSSSAASVIWSPKKICDFDFVSSSFFSCGSDHCACLTTNGELYTWGRNNCGQLGHGDTKDRVEPALVTFPLTSQVTHVSCGFNFTICMCRNGSIYVFGDNTYGQLGLETDPICNKPMELSWFREFNITLFASGRRTSYFFSSSKRSAYVCGLSAFHLTNENCSPGFIETCNQSGKFAPIQLPMISWMTKEKWNLFNPNLFYIASGQDTDVALLFLSTSSDPYICSKILRRDHRFASLVEKLEFNPDNLAKPHYDICKKNHVSPFSKIVKDIFYVPGNFGQSSVLPSSHYYDLKNPNLDVFNLNLAYRMVLSDSSTSQCLAVCILGIVNRIFVLDQYSLTIETKRAIFLLLFAPILPEEEFSISVAKTFDRVIHLAFQTSIEVHHDIVTWLESICESSLTTLVKTCKSRVLMMMYNVKFTNQSTSETKPWFPLIHNLLQYFDILYRVHISNNLMTCDQFYIPEIQKSYPYLYEVDSYLQQIPPMFYGNESSSIERLGNSEVFYITEHMYILDTIAKSEIINREALRNTMISTEALLFSNLQAIANFFMFQNDQQSEKLSLSIDRNNLLSHFVSTIIDIPRRDLFKNLKIHFLGEAADDLGGVKEEFFLLFFREIYDKKYQYFVHYNDSRFVWFNPNNEFYTVYYAFGIAVALAVYNKIIINLPFPIALTKKILNRPLNISDLHELDNEIGKSLMDLLQIPSATVEDLGLTFSIDQESNGRIDTVELCSSEKNIVVTSNNRHEYVQAYVDYVLHKSVNRQFKNFLKGFNMIYARSFLKKFDPEELMNMIIGCKVYDFTAFQRATKYTNGYDQNHRVIKLFWTVFHSFDLEMKKKFLKFLTGSDRVPISGFSSIPMTIQKVDGGPGHQYLPVSHTCYRILDLPPYSSFEMMRRKLTKALEYTEGFGLT